jgi:hypothetical protein
VLSYPALENAQRSPAVNQVVGDDICRRFLEPELVELRRHRKAAGDVAFPKSQQTNGVALVNAMRAFLESPARATVPNPPDLAAAFERTHRMRSRVVGDCTASKDRAFLPGLDGAIEILLVEPHATTTRYPHDRQMTA